MSWKRIGQLSVGWIAARSVYSIVRNIVLSTTPAEELKPKDVLMTKIGTIIISGMIGKSAVKFTSEALNSIFAFMPKVTIEVVKGESNDEGRHEQTTE